MFEKVVHVAYRCGCVRSFHVKHQRPEVRCPKHGDAQLSFTEERVPQKAAAG